MSQPISYQGPKACPFCGAHESKPVGFTWWGGVLGPKLFSHVKCLKCGKCFNGKKGTSNDTAIVLYIVISGVIVAAVFVMMFVAGFFAR